MAAGIWFPGKFLIFQFAFSFFLLKMCYSVKPNFQFLHETFRETFHLILEWQVHGHLARDDCDSMIFHVVLNCHGKVHKWWTFLHVSSIVNTRRCISDNAMQTNIFYSFLAGLDELFAPSLEDISNGMMKPKTETQV